MAKELNESMIMKALEWGYKKSLNPGVPGLDSAYELAQNYLDHEGTLQKKVDSLIRWQDSKAATSGFITGLGGLITLPVAIPANISSVLFVQIRMIAALAIMGGYDVTDDKVKSLVYVCLLGNAANEVMKQVGIKLGTKMSEQAIKKLSFEVIKQINQKVGFRLLTKFGEKGIINLGKAIPIVGGVVSGTLDAMSTHGIGKIAKNIFIKD
jgi:uncharacterized protein (DUF697 family)